MPEEPTTPDALAALRRHREARSSHGGSSQTSPTSQVEAPDRPRAASVEACLEATDGRRPQQTEEASTGESQYVEAQRAARSRPQQAWLISHARGPWFETRRAH
jgi:hypothetical protein